MSSEETKSNGSPPPPDADVLREWLPTNQVLKELKISVRTLARYKAEGLLIPVNVHGFGDRYDPEEVRQLKPAGSDDAAFAKEATATIRELREALAEERAHQRSFVQLMQQPVKDFATLTSEEVARMRSRVDSLEGNQVQFIALRERMLSEEESRRLAREHAQANEVRIDKAIDRFLTVGPELLGGLLGLKPGTGSQLGQVLELVQSFSDEQVTVLLASGFLTPEQAANLQRLRPPKKEGQEKNGSSIHSQE